MKESKGKVKRKRLESGGKGKGSKEERKAVKTQLDDNVSYDIFIFYVASFAMGSVFNIQQTHNDRKRKMSEILMSKLLCFCLAILFFHLPVSSYGD